MSGSGAMERVAGSFSAAATNGARDSKKRTPPVSIRFSADERAALLKHTNGEALGPYIKRFVLSRHSAKRPRRKTPTKQHQAIARTLRGLGGSGVSGVLGSFILAFEEGRLMLNRDEERELRRAMADVTAMRSDLIAALGLRNDGSA